MGTVSSYFPYSAFMRFFYPLLGLGVLATLPGVAQVNPSASTADTATVATSAAATPTATLSQAGYSGTAPTTDTEPKKSRFGASDKPSFIPVPIAFYQQETGFAGGAAILPVWRFGTDTTVRKSNVRLIAWISQKKQTTLQLTHNIFTPGEKFFLSGELSYYDLAFDYFGIGNETNKDYKSEIQYPLWVFDEKALVRVVPNLFVGLRYRFTDLGNVENKNEGDLLGPYNFLTAKERNGYTTSGLGPALLYDGRDNVLATYRGNFVDAHMLFHGSGIGSDYKFTRYQIDARHFNPLFGTNNTILALQFLGQYHSGSVPFRELGGMGATLGGSLYNNAYLMRGIYEARYRDRQFSTFQAEIRQKLFWRFDVAGFLGVGQVGYKLSDYELDGTKFAGGGGLRFRFNRRDRLNIRLDYGVGSGGNSGIIFAVGEAF